MNPLAKPEIRAHISSCVRDVCRRYHRPDLTADAIQDAYVRCLEAVPKWNPERSSIRTWLGLNARWAAIRTIHGSEWRPATGLAPDPPESNAETPERIAERNERAKDVARALDVLSPLDRTLVMAPLAGETLRQVGSRSGICYATARRRRSHALARLGKVLAIGDR